MAEYLHRPDPTKCTEPVASSSDFPTDRRRSDNRSESHQPWTLRTRCIAELGRMHESVKASRMKLSQIAVFSFHNSPCCATVCALAAGGEEKRAGPVGPAARIRRAGNAFVHLPDEPSASA